MTSYAVRDCYRIVSIPFATLEVTGKCNSRCQTCNVWKMQAESNREARDEMRREEFCQVIAQLKELGCSSIELHGGEPTLRSDLPDLIAQCSALRIGTMFATNGLNMSEKLASELVKAGLSQIRFSLEGTRETHNLIRGRKDAFDRQMQAIGAIQRADTQNRVTKIINTTISSMNIQGIEEIAELAKQTGIHHVLVFSASVIEPQAAEQTNAIFQEEVVYHRSLVDPNVRVRDPDLIERKREQLLKKAREHNIRLNNSTFFTMPASAVARGIKRPPGPCSRIYHACTVDSFGDVVPCEYVRYKLGSVRESDLKTILTGGRFRAFSRLYSQNVDRLRICDYCCHSL